MTFEEAKPLLEAGQLVEWTENGVFFIGLKRDGLYHLAGGKTLWEARVDWRRSFEDG